MQIIVEDILKHNPCDDWPEERIRKYLGKGLSPMKALSLRGVSAEDKIWCATRFLPDKLNREFVIWCARQCKTDIKEIEQYIDAIERFYEGPATKREIGAAGRAAYWAADWAAYRTADRAAYWSADWAAILDAARRRQLKKIKEIVERFEKEGE